MLPPSVAVLWRIHSYCGVPAFENVRKVDTVVVIPSLSITGLMGFAEQVTKYHGARYHIVTTGYADAVARIMSAAAAQVRTCTGVLAQRAACEALNLPQVLGAMVLKKHLVRVESAHNQVLYSAADVEKYRLYMTLADLASAEAFYKTQHDTAKAARVGTTKIKDKPAAILGTGIFDALFGNSQKQAAPHPAPSPSEEHTVSKPVETVEYVVLQKKKDSATYVSGALHLPKGTTDAEVEDALRSHMLDRYAGVQGLSDVFSIARVIVSAEFAYTPSIKRL
jgi:hypothetical protein